MKTKVSTAVGPTLDWMVAKGEGKNGVLHDDGITRCIVIAAASGVYKGTFKPTENWSQGGPIIEREGIELERADRWQSRKLWIAQCGTAARIIGPTPLIAAMRCYVANKLGEEVEVPDEAF